MNSLSWFLYFADITPSIGAFFFAISCIGAITIGVQAIYTYNFNNHWKVVEEAVPPKPYPKKRWYVLAVACGLIFTIIPSRNTMYAIAASELGQSAVESKLGTKAMQAIEAWIDSQIPKVANKKD